MLHLHARYMNTRIFLSTNVLTLQLVRALDYYCLQVACILTCLELSA